MEREEMEQMARQLAARQLAAKPASEATYLEHVAALALQASMTGRVGEIPPDQHARSAIHLANIFVAMLAASSKSPFDHYEPYAQSLQQDRELVRQMIAALTDMRGDKGGNTA